MQSFRAVVGMCAGLMLILSAGAHSLAGWPGLRAQLLAAQVPVDLLAGLGMGWHFGGASMLVFGVLMFALFIARFRGERVAAWPAMLIGAMYVAFAAWVTVQNGWDAFYLVFLVPGMLLLAAAL